MAWANQEVYAAVQTLPLEALGSFIVNPEWTAGAILEHIAGSAEWYVYCLTGNHNGWSTTVPATMDDVASLATLLAGYDAALLDLANESDGVVSFTNEYGTRSALRSTIISQVIHHATEHRAQLVDALESRGHRPVNLDDLDLWAFEARAN